MNKLIFKKIGLIMDIFKKREFFRLMTYMKPRMVGFLFGILMYCIVESLLSVCVALVMKDIVNAAFSRNMSHLTRAMEFVSVVAVIVCITLPILSYIYKKRIKETMNEIRKTTFRHIEELPITYFEQHHSGDIISRMNDDIMTVEYVYSDGLRSIISTVLLAVFSMITMIALDWRISVCLLIICSLVWFVNQKISKSLRRINNFAQKYLSKITQRFSDIINGFKEMKIFHIEDIIVGKFDAVNRKLTYVNNISVKRYALLESINYLLAMLSFAGMVAFGGFLVYKKEVDFGTLTALVKLQANLTIIAMTIGYAIANYQRSLAGAGRLFEILDEKTEKEYTKDCEEVEVGKRPMLGLKNVMFSYIENKAVLEDVNIDFEEGKITALVGPSGGGKSTVIKLLLGFYPMQGGTITLGGKDIKKYTLDQLRGKIAYVPQDAYLFDGTIEENIKHGNPYADNEKVITAAKAANAHDFISELPENYYTYIGEKGSKLSGGQKQRIAIARAILKDSPILIFDEATSSLDSQSENIIKNTLENVAGKKTVIAVAHRLSTIEKADRIYVIDKGKVVESGDHKYLLSINGLYCKLYNIQFD